MKKVLILSHALARSRAVEAVKTAQDGMVVTISEPTRNSSQSAKFHAICEDLAKSELTWCDKKRSAAEWKVLLVSAHAMATNEGSEIVVGLEGELVNVRESTALMSKKRGSSLIDYATAFCAQNGIETGE